MVIIPVAGKAGSGKDEAAKRIKEKLEELNKRVLVMHYADYLKLGCSLYKGWNGEKDEAGRTLLQQTGTEEIRSKYPDFWVDGICKWINASLRNLYDVILLPDARFVNEIEYIKGFKFDRPVMTLPLKVTRLKMKSNLKEDQQQHASEVSLDNYEGFSYYMDVAEGLDELEKEVSLFVNSYIKRYYF